MTVAAAAGLWAWLRAAVALAFAASETVGTSVTGQPNVTIIEPSSLYKTEGLCQYSYDALAAEPLRFNLTVTCGSRSCDSVHVRRYSSLAIIKGCRRWCDNGQSSCSHGCTANKALNSSVDEEPYIIEAEARSQYHGMVPKTTYNICVNVQDRAYIHFVGIQTTNVTSENSSVLLSYSADGYPRPVSYELACNQQRLASLTGSLKLTNLTVGMTQCTMVAYTDRRLAFTPRLAVTIHVVAGQRSAPSSNGNDAHSRATTSLLSTNLQMVQSLTSEQQDFSEETKGKQLLFATVIPCVVLSLISVIFVGYAIFKRRTEQLAATRQGSDDSGSVQRNAPHVAPIINNSSTIYNYYGDHVEILGPGSSVVVHGRPICGVAVRALDADRDRC